MWRRMKVFFAQKFALIYHLLNGVAGAALYVSGLLGHLLVNMALFALHPRMAFPQGVFGGFTQACAQTQAYQEQGHYHYVFHTVPANG